MIAEQGHLQVQLARMIVEQVGFELDGPNLQRPEGVQYVVGYRPTSADKLTRWFGSCPVQAVPLALLSLPTLTRRMQRNNLSVPAIYPADAGRLCK